MTSFSLRSLRLRPGEEYRDEKEVALEPLQLGGQRYLPVPEKVQAEVVVSRVSSGTVFELRYRTRLHGPCYRCLADAVVDAEIAAREYQATSSEATEELRTPYLANDQLDLSAWARDALVLELPDKILCRPDCAGLCPVCGRDLNLDPHAHDDVPGTGHGRTEAQAAWLSARRVRRLSRADISSCLAPDLAERDVWLYSSAGHGSPEAKTVEVAPRQAACAASSPGAARERVPGLPPAEAAAPRLPELQDVPRARSRAAENPGALGR